MRPTPCCAAMLCCAAALSQDLRWNLPERGAALYRRVLTVDTKVEPKGAPASLPWGGPANASVVLAGELDDKGRRPAEPIEDPRELLAALCLDLGAAKAGKERRAVAGGRLPDCELVASYGAPGNDGRQEVEATLEERKADRIAAPRGGVPHVRATVHGSRLVDREQGRVAAFEGVIEFQCDYQQPERTVRCTIHDAWTFDQLLAPTDGVFRTLVADGIRKAVAALERQLDGELRRGVAAVADPHFDTQPGSLALLLLALVKGGADPHGARIQNGFDELRKRQIEGTYSLALAILAVEALYTPPGEWQALREGRIKAPMPRQLGDGDRKVVGEWTQTLLGNIDTTVDAAYLRRWHYGPSKSWDNSNTQYALLGLYGAQLCGVALPPVVWTAAANHWFAVARPAGDEAAPDLVTHGEQEQREQGRRTRARGRKVPEVGWAYHQSGDPTGSMTCAGVAGLTICAAALAGQRKSGSKLLHQIDDEVRGGFLWLQHNLSVRRNPGPAAGWDNWYYYYLYGLERACELNQVALLGGRDWYFEGALQLLGQQGKDGGWGAAWDTCFALLFLKKASLPAITPR